MREKLGVRDLRFITICVAIAIGCGIVAWLLFERAFPQASIEFQVNRNESGAVATAFLDELQLGTEGTKHAAVFDYDDEAKIFLERELGLDSAPSIYQDIRLWRWNHRWFRPGEKEELSVEIGADGQVAGFTHLLSEAKPGAALEADSARAVAEAFLVRRMRTNLGDFEFVEGSAARLPHRVDHTFTWKKVGFDLAASSYRMRVQVSGDAVTEYAEFLEIPQAWQDDYARLRSRNETAALVATFLLLLTALAMVVVLVLRIRDRDVRWPTAVAFGSVAFALQLLAVLNQFDVAKFDYETQNSYASFVTLFLLQAVFGALASSGFILLLTAAAEPLYRERYPAKMSLTSFFTPRGFRTKSFFEQVLLGTALMAFFAAYQAVFYLVAGRFGAWAPLEVPYDNMLNTAIPWAIVLFIGFFPAVSEEFMSRMFSIPFLEKLGVRAGLGSRAGLMVGVLLASFVWGFAHSNYPNQPFWVRGVEVGIAGVLVSVVMLRWGILATLVWHYTVDALYTAFLLLRSGNSYFVVSGAITAGVMLVPLATAIGLYFVRGGFEPETGLTNADEKRPVREAAAVSAVAVAVTQAPVPRRRILVGAAVAAALLLLYLVPAHEPGENLRVRCTREEALQAARAKLRAMGGDPDRFHVAVAMTSRYDADVGRYILERKPLAALDSVYASHLRTPVWRVRFFDFEQREEYVFNLPVDTAAESEPAAIVGSPHAEDTVPALPEFGIPMWAFEHVLPDSAPGDTLALDAAQALASQFLLRRGIDVAGLVLKESSSEKRPSRTDHRFEWQIPDASLGEAGVRYMVLVQGNAIGGLRPYMHLPEDWIREREKRSAVQQVLRVLGLAVLCGVVMVLFVLFVQQVRQRCFPWRAALGWGVGGGIASVVLLGLRWESEVVMQYQTTMPQQLFHVASGISVAVRFLAGVLVALLVGTALGAWPHALAGRGRRFASDAVLLMLVGVAFTLGLDRLDTWIGALGSRDLEVTELGMFESAGRKLAWFDDYLTLLRDSVLKLAVLASLVYTARSRYRDWRWLAGGAAALLALAAGDAQSVPQFLFELTRHGVTLAGLVFLLLYLFRDHMLAYVLTLLASEGIGIAAGWFRQPVAAYVQQGVVFSVLLVTTLVVLILLASRRKSVG